MKLQITINTDNAAFEDNPDELRDILLNAADKAENCTDGFARKLLDSNGNAVGEIVALMQVLRNKNRNC